MSPVFDRNWLSSELIFVMAMYFSVCLYVVLCVCVCVCVRACMHACVGVSSAKSIWGWVWTHLFAYFKRLCTWMREMSQKWGWKALTSLVEFYQTAFNHWRSMTNMFMSVDLLTQFQPGTASQANIWMKLDGQPSAQTAISFQTY